MKKSITRRDFLNGAAVSLVAGTTLGPRDILAKEIMKQADGTVDQSQIAKEYYPPTLTGIRGSHKGSFEVAHKLAWQGQKPTEYTALEEGYDLVVVGGGLSGLAAAFLYRQKMGDDKKILIMDNHDDFGGHARRNEFHQDGRMFLSAGGSHNLETHKFSDNVTQLVEEIGVDFEKLEAARDPNYMFADSIDGELCYYLNAQQYGEDRIVEGRWSEAMRGEGNYLELISSLNLPAEQQKRFVALIEGKEDLLGEMSLSEKEEYIYNTSYQEFLSSRAGLASETIALVEPIPQLYAGLGLDCYSVREAMSYGAPGFKSLGAGELVGKVFPPSTGKKRMTPIFPDGNASVARLLVRKLIPEVAPGNTMEDIVEARFDYSQLDRVDAPVRLRLNSTVVNVVNRDADEGKGVIVSYVNKGTVNKGRAYTVSAKHCILACNNGIIPHLCPEIPTAQKEALKYGVKLPFVFTSVMLRSGAAVRKSGVVQHLCPGSFHNVVIKAPPVNLGTYRGGSRGEEPLLLSMTHVPTPQNNGKQSGRDLLRLGRHRLYTTPFSTYEMEVKNQLTSMFGANGFDAERDIEAITVNRWSHGYAYVYMDLYDPLWREQQAPHEVGRKPIGRISIANSDSEAIPYLQGAVDAAWRAVEEQTRG